MSAALSTAFVTGGAGFVGGRVLRALAARGVEVRALHRGPLPSELATLAGIEWVMGDLLQPAGWAERLVGCGAVFHLAARYSAHAADAALLYRINTGGTRALLAAAATAGVSTVIHTSTIGTIGRRGDGLPPDEHIPFNLWSTASAYVRSKWLGEAVARWWAARGLRVMIVHPTAPVGAGDHKPTATGQRIVDFLAGQRPDYPAGGINFCPVQNIADGHLLAAAHGQPGRAYILGHTAGNLDEGTFLDLLAKVSGHPIPPALSTRRPRGPQSLAADPRRAVQELGMPQTSLHAAFAEAVAFAART